YYEINFSGSPGAPADGPVPRALLPPGAAAERDRPGARRLRGDGLAAPQTRLRRGLRPGRARPATRRGARGGAHRAVRPARGGGRGRGGTREGGARRRGGRLLREDRVERDPRGALVRVYPLRDDPSAPGA